MWSSSFDVFLTYVQFEGNWSRLIQSTVLPNVKFRASLLNGSQIVTYDTRTERSTLMCVEGSERSVFHIHKTDRQINFNMAETNGHVNFNVHPEEIRLSENTEQPHNFKLSNLKKYLFCMNLEGALSSRYSRIVLTERLIANDGLNSSWKEVVLTYFIGICRRYWRDWKKP